MQPDRFTIKSQEALQAAQRLADERRNPQTRPEHLLAVLLEQDGGVVVPVLRKLGVDPAAVRATLNPALEALPRLAQRRPRADRWLHRADPGPARRRRRRCASSRTSTSRPSIWCSRSPTVQGTAGDVLRSVGAGHDALLKARERGPRRPARHRPEPRGQVPGAGEVRPRPHRGGRRRQARPGDRPRR